MTNTLTHEQRKFILAFGIIQQYAKDNLAPEHAECLTRTYNSFCSKNNMPTPQKIAALLQNKDQQENISLPEISLCPAAVPEQWDDIEVSPIYEEKDENGKGFCEVVTDDETEIHFYSVYLRNVEGGVSCIADCTSESQAQVLADLIAQAAKNYKDNGFLNDSKL